MWKFSVAIALDEEEIEEVLFYSLFPEFREYFGMSVGTSEKILLNIEEHNVKRINHPNTKTVSMSKVTMHCLLSLDQSVSIILKQ